MRPFPHTVALLTPSAAAVPPAGLDATVVILVVGIALAVGLILAAIHRAVRRSRSLRRGAPTRKV